jgi:uncharacterized protein (DUF934 family)
MTEPSPQPRLWTPDGFRDDDWAHGMDADALASNGKIILPLAAFLGLDPQARADALPRLGVLVAPGETLDALLEFLPSLSMIALAFPAFNDGRSFSKAQLLRSRHGYAGALRAVGQVLVDQLPHMLRVGFDEFEVTNPVLLKRLEAGRTGGLGVYYQPAAKQAVEGERYVWRRRPSKT